MSSGAQRLPLWAEIALTAGLVFALVSFGAACAFLVTELGLTRRGGSAFVIIVFLVVVPFLVYYAYPPGRRRWYHFAIFELCALGGFTLPIPVVYLPWLIVTRREWLQG